MGRTRASAAVAAAASDTAGGANGWEFRGAAKSQDATDNYSYCLIEGVDPDVYDLCIEYEVDDRKMRRLHQLMMTRIDTFESDILKLWDSVKNARSPSAVITTKMRDMENGTFIGKAPKRYYSEKPLKDFFRRHDIDALCKDSLADALYDRRLRIIRERKLRGGGTDGDGFPEKDMSDILDKLSREIDGSRNPSALVMRHVPGIEAGTGSWESVGQVQKCKEAPVEKIEVEVSKEELRAQDDREAQQLEKSKRAQPKRDGPVAKSSKEVPKKATKPAKTKNHSAVPAFDSAELAKRLSTAEMQNEPTTSCDTARSNEASVAPAPPPSTPAPSPPTPAPPIAPPVAVPPPELVKRNMLPVKLSKKSLELVEKDGAKEEDVKAPVESGKAPASASNMKSSKTQEEDDEDLEMASIALGRPIAELRQLPKDKVRSLVLASLEAGGASDRSVSPSIADDEEEGVEGFDEMSELEIAAIALGRPIEELRKLSAEELRCLIAGNEGHSPGHASRTPSPVKEPSEGLDRKVPPRQRSKSRDKTKKEVDAKKRSRSNVKRRQGSTSRSRSCARRSGAQASAKHRSETRAHSRSSKRDSRSSKHSPRRADSRSPRQKSRARKGSPPRKYESQDRGAGARVSRRSASRSRSDGRGRTRR